ncbi:class I SAM-dependent methyltransferase [Sphaerisporangium flaviroseum]|uniref:Class I SAM-dependent methyltransferase n=1 Tax=Sphaerisporangium flaviroseum TaxID=509199 RepID=A0ABP7HM30_9ACTN
MTSIDLGRHPRGNGFLLPEEVENEFFFHLTVGMCDACTMVQLQSEVPQEIRYHDAYPYHASGSAVHRRHFEQNARHFLDTELTGPDPFIVEIGSNDGVMLATIAQAGVRHLGVEPSKEVAEMSMAKGVRVLSEFFDESTAGKILFEHGPADVVFGANCIAHIAHLASVFRGVETLLAPNGVFVFEEPYLGSVVGQVAFDMIYDEHSFYFAVRSVQAMAARFDLELVNVEPLALHGGTMRYTIARPSMRTPTPAVGEWLAKEKESRLGEKKTLERFGVSVERIRDDLNALLRKIHAEGGRVVGYGAPAKAATVTNYCGIGPDLVPFVCDSTPSKQGRLVAGSHIPVRSPEEFRADYPEYALLFAWNHAEEIMANEKEFRERGGRWILYVPDVHIV